MASFFGTIAALALTYSRSRFAQPGSRWEWFNSGLTPKANQLVATIVLCLCGVWALIGLWFVVVG